MKKGKLVGWKMGKYLYNSVGIGNFIVGIFCKSFYYIVWHIVVFVSDDSGSGSQGCSILLFLETVTFTKYLASCI